MPDAPHHLCPCKFATVMCTVGLRSPKLPLSSRPSKAYPTFSWQQPSLCWHLYIGKHILCYKSTKANGLPGSASQAFKLIRSDLGRSIELLAPTMPHFHLVGKTGFDLLV